MNRAMRLLVLFLLLGFAACTLLAPPSANLESVKVEVTGRGLSTEEARRDARSKALDEAIGALVDAEVRLSQGQAIEDIITASAGYVDRFDIVEEGRTRDGAHFVRAVVSVQANQLRRRFGLHQAGAQSIDGVSLYAKGTSKTEARSSISRILSKNLADYPECTMRGKIVGQPEILDSAGSTWIMGWRIELSLSDEKWYEATEVVRAALRQLATEQFSWKMDVSPFAEKMDYLEAPDSQDWSLLRRPEDFLQQIGFESRRQTRDIPEDQCLVCIPSTTQWGGRVDGFLVPRDCMIDFARLSASRSVLEFRLHDNVGRQILSESMSMDIGPKPESVDWSAIAEQASRPQVLPGWFLLSSAGRSVPPEGLEYKCISGADLAGPMDDGQYNSNDRFVFLPGAMRLDWNVYGRKMILRLALPVEASVVESIAGAEVRFVKRSVDLHFEHAARRGGATKTVQLRSSSD